MSNSTQQSSQPNTSMHTLALWVVWIGAGVALAASLYRYSVDGVLPTQTVVMAGLALLASVPVYISRKRLIESR